MLSSNVSLRGEEGLRVWAAPEGGAEEGRTGLCGWRKAHQMVRVDHLWAPRALPEKRDD